MGIFSAIRKESKHFWRARSLFLIGLPAVIVVFIFYYLPMYGIVIAFKDINYAKGIWGSDWVGLHNFKFFFNSQDAFRITRNTLLLNGLFIVVGMSCALVIGLLLAELGRRWVKLFQTILFFPYFLSWVVVGFVSYILLNPSFGVINKTLEQLHLTPIDWYSKPGYWPLILTLTYLWKNVGYTAIIFFTGLLSIDNSYYEAASIDGASRLQQIRKISIPLILPLITMLFMLNVGRIFYSDFGLFYFVPRDAGMLYPTTDVVDTYVFRSLRVVGDLGMASAASLYQAVVGLVLVITTNVLVRKFNKENALF
ncbi:ABC transporter permease subunit [Paenibacillus qinlingensis]|uniref:Aldouronate transport system permease protein n=1 Tax=Paenibacillus qinlingensis TaxID=1837343 RepID=A0ABU1NVV5_9BACL|nr:ABC transporter permease subunit [Paenibacillus qinlingensis]MDR6551613.1 putative aldouronate transport system permease protein [Paenibacillus qinlingensis]